MRDFCSIMMLTFSRYGEHHCHSAMLFQDAPKNSSSFISSNEVPLLGVNVSKLRDSLVRPQAKYVRTSTALSRMYFSDEKPTKKKLELVSYRSDCVSRSRIVDYILHTSLNYFYILIEVQLFPCTPFLFSCFLSLVSTFCLFLAAFLASCDSKKQLLPQFSVPANFRI